MNGATDAAVERLVAEIGGMSLDQLRNAWRARYSAPPPLRSVPILRQLLAWRIQVDADGGIDGETKKALRRTGAVAPEGLHLGIGARLTRTWQGRLVEVVVENGGFRWNGTLYRSLSAAATAIAGSKWNGPRFFGLREAA